MATKHGAFLDDIWTFDNAFFNITPREAKSMDPQQRILLHTAQSALDDAGYVPDATPTFTKASMGCYIGVATGDYTDNLRNDIDVFYSPG
jgi:acyl transferase domain-containing protein